jgi:hypothetical protein
MACHRTTTAPEPATVPVEWHQTTSDTSSEHACHIGDALPGRSGERVQTRDDEVEILRQAGM